MINQAQVCLPVLNLYAQPDDASEVISQALYGWTVAILEKHPPFCYIQTDDDYQGWVEMKSLAPFSFLPESARKVKVIYNRVPVYPSPHVKSNPLWILPFEVELAVLNENSEEEGRWIQVALIEGRTGWIQRGHIKWNEEVLSLTQMLQLSRQFLGLPYIWGGTSSFGYDCSGFVQMLARQRGIALPRDAKQQMNAANCLSLVEDQLQAGDLLFYGSCATDIRHVGVYIGNQQLIHASVKPIPIIQESHLNDPSLIQRFAYRTARRLNDYTCKIEKGDKQACLLKRNTKIKASCRQ